MASRGRSTSNVLSILTIVALLTGCATAAQRQYQSLVTANQALGAQARACFTELYNAPEAAVLRPHFPLDSRDATLAQLADTSLATQPEIDAINLLYPRFKACQKGVLEGLVHSGPSAVPILAKAYSAGDDDTILLIQRKLSWGERLRRGRDRQIAAQAALQAEGQRITAALERSHEAEIAQRQVAVQAAAAAAAQYGARLNQPAMPPPTFQSPIQTQHCVSQRDPISGIGGPTYRMNCTTY